jgi:RimJ/RimL family protein N-acetyltransferase
MLRLVPTTQADIAHVVAAEADDDTSPFILPWSAERHKTALADPDCAHLAIRHATTGDWLGFVLLFGLASPHHAIELRRVVCARKGAGIGRAAVRAVVALAFGELAAHRLWLDVKTTNTRARHLYTTEGFVEEGILRECLLGPDGFESLVLMSMLITDSGRP